MTTPTPPPLGAKAAPADDPALTLGIEGFACAGRAEAPSAASGDRGTTSHLRPQSPPDDRGRLAEGMLPATIVLRFEALERVA